MRIYIHIYCIYVCIHKNIYVYFFYEKKKKHLCIHKFIYVTYMYFIYVYLILQYSLYKNIFVYFILNIHSLVSNLHIYQNDFFRAETFLNYIKTNFADLLSTYCVFSTILYVCFLYGYTRRYLEESACQNNTSVYLSIHSRVSEKKIVENFL